MAKASRLSRRGLLIVISAPSGAGKTTVVESLLAHDRRLWRSVSATTRQPRQGEREGRDYYFLSEGAFCAKIRRRGFLEWARVFGRYYGTPKRPVELCQKKGRDVVLVIDVQGAHKIRKMRKALSIFIKPPSLKELKRRLLGRKTDAPGERRGRLAMARWEMAQADKYDYVIVNREVKQTVSAIERIIQSARSCSIY